MTRATVKNVPSDTSHRSAELIFRRTEQVAEHFSSASSVGLPVSPFHQPVRLIINAKRFLIDVNGERERVVPVICLSFSARPASRSEEKMIRGNLLFIRLREDVCHRVLLSHGDVGVQLGCGKRRELSFLVNGKCDKQKTKKDKEKTSIEFRMKICREGKYRLN